MNDSIYLGNAENSMLFHKDSSQIQGEEEEKPKTYDFPMKNTTVALLNHPASITLYHYVSVEVISGTVSVNGYEMNESNIPLKVFSSEKTELVEVKTESFDRIWKKKAHTSSLEEKLYHITANSEKARDILQNFGNSTVAICVRRCAFPPSIHCLDLYYPHILYFDLFKKTWKSKTCNYVPKNKGTPIEFDLAAENLASEINCYVRSAKLTESPAPRIVVCGPKNTGKSTLLRFLINKILSIYVVAYYLDTDPGQAEFTPPGLVSLTKVTKPIIGLPFTHLKKPECMIFTGGISANSSPDMYIKSVSKLVELYDEMYSDEPLFVNTMGWMEGLGMHCLQNVMVAVKPTILVELVTEDECSMFDYREYMPKNSAYIQLHCTSKSGGIPPPEAREITLLSYFGQCQSLLEGPVYLNDIKPYCVSWDKIPVFVFGKKVTPLRMVESMNASIVALCKVPDTVILDSEIPQLPKILEEEPDNECLGYGLVRAIDETKHLLYIISPLKLEEIQQVNAIIKGNVMVPNAVFFNQPLYDTSLPFTNENEKQFTNEKEKQLRPEEPDEEMADCSMVSLKSLDFDSPAAAYGSVDSYRRKIPRRHSRTKKRHSNKQ